MMDNLEIKKLLLLLNPYQKKIILLFIFMFISAIISFLFPLLTKKIMDDGFIPGNFHVILMISISMFFLVFLHQSIELIKEKCRTQIKAQLVYSLYQKALIHICKIQIAYLNRNNAELLNKLNTDITTIALLSDNAFLFIITQLFNVFGGVVGLFTINWEMALLVLLFIPIKYYFILYFSKKKKSLTQDMIKSNADFAQWFENTVAGIEEIKMFHLLDAKMREFEPLQQRNVNIERSVTLLSSYNNILDRILIELLTSIIYIIGAVYVLEEFITVGSVFAFITYLIYVTAPISALLNIKYMLAGIIPSSQRYFSFLETPEEQSQGQKIVVREEMPAVEFRNVCFRYQGSTVDILEHINFRIYPGEKIAIIGKNGVGKSTLLRLLLRLYNPTNGIIKVYGENIQTYDLKSYRKIFSVVSQNMYLFETDFSYNITFENQCDDPRLDKVLHQANLVEDIEKKSSSYNLGRNGDNLSGGQKQKIALARALYVNGDIFIFDEATANLDAQSKSSFHELLRTCLKDKTVIVITHEEDILSYMDRVLYMENGRCN